MKNMKRFAALLLAGAMMLVMLTGCSIFSTISGGSLGEQYVDAYIEHINSVRSSSMKKLENDKKIEAICNELLNTLDENGVSSDKYGCRYFEDRKGYVELLMDDTSYDEVFAYAISAEDVTELLTRKSQFTDIQLERFRKMYDSYTAIGASYREINGKTYVAYGYVTTDEMKG